MAKCLKTLGIISPSQNFLLKPLGVTYRGKVTNIVKDFKWVLEMFLTFNKQTRCELHFEVL